MGVSFRMRYIPCWVFFRIHIYMVLMFLDFFPFYIVYLLCRGRGVGVARYNICAETDLECCFVGV